MPRDRDEYLNQLTDDLELHRRRIAELERLVVHITKGKLPEQEELDPEMIRVESMVSSKTLNPRVVIRWFTHYAQLDEHAARGLAFQILEACEASLADSFLATFTLDKLNLDGPARAGIIMEFRAHRERLIAEARQEGIETSL